LQHSKGLAVALKALWCNQTARGLLQRQLAEERRRARGLVVSLEGRDVEMRDRDATVRPRSLAMRWCIVGV
jgi:hypothetical protein